MLRTNGKVARGVESWLSRREEHLSTTLIGSSLCWLRSRSVSDTPPIVSTRFIPEFFSWKHFLKTSIEAGRAVIRFCRGLESSSKNLLSWKRRMHLEFDIESWIFVSFCHQTFCRLFFFVIFSFIYKWLKRLKISWEIFVCYITYFIVSLIAGYCFACCNFSYQNSGIYLYSLYSIMKNKTLKLFKFISFKIKSFDVLFRQTRAAQARYRVNYLTLIYVCIY